MGINSSTYAIVNIVVHMNNKRSMKSREVFLRHSSATQLFIMPVIGKIYTEKNEKDQSEAINL